MFSPATRSATKDLLHLAWPVILARLGIMTMGLTDVIVVGNWSGEELAYSSLALAPMSIVVTTAGRAIIMGKRGSSSFSAEAPAGTST